MEENKTKKDSTFYIHWLSLLLGMVLGFIAVIFIFLTQAHNKRDKVYSSLLGMAIGMLVNFYLIRHFGLLKIN